MKISEKAYKNAILNLNECKQKKTVLTSYPLKLYIEPTMACNLRCSYCYPPKMHLPKRLDMNIFHALEKQLFDNICEVNLFLSGEPVLHENFSEMLETCSKYSLLTKFFTNLSYKKDSILQKMVETGCWVNVSFDGFEQNVMRQDSDVDLIISNLKKLQEYQREIRHEKFYIRIASVIGKHNVARLSSLVEWVSSMGISELMLGCLDVFPKIAQYRLTSEDAIHFNKAMHRADMLGVRLSMPTHIDGIRLEKTSNWNDFSLDIDEYFPHFCEDCNPDVESKFCPYPWIQTIIDSNGNVVSCCQRKILLGKFTLDTDFIQDIWNNEYYQEIRSVNDYTNCKLSDEGICNMTKYSIWGGEQRLNNIPQI